MKVKILALFILVSLRAFCQEYDLSDSTFMFSIPSREIQALKKNATFLLRSPISQVSRVGLEYKNTSGSFKKAQMPGSSDEITFVAEGIKTLGNFKLFGNFDYSKIMDNDLAYSLRGEGPDDQPFYTIAGFPSKFSRQRYHADGLISYSLLKDKLYLSSGFNYIYYLADRSVDPRMSLTWFDFQAKPELTFVRKNWNIGVGGLWGYGVETTGIRYKKKDYVDSPIYEDRISYLNYGYGYLPYSSKSFSRKKSYKGGSLNAAGEYGLWNILLSLNYVQAMDRNIQSLNQSLKNENFSDYTSDTWSGYMLLTRKYKQNQKQLELSYSNLNGEDYIYDMGGKNYTTWNKEASVSFTNADTKRNNTFEYGVSMNYRNTYKKDAVSAHQFEYSYIQPGITGGWYHKLPNKSRYAVNLSPSVILPFNTNASAPLTQQIVFAQSVMFPDYIYHSITSGMLNLKLNYINTTWSKSFKTGFAINTSYVETLKRPEVLVPAKTTPGNNRLFTNISLNLYF